MQSQITYSCPRTPPSGTVSGPRTPRIQRPSPVPPAVAAQHPACAAVAPEAHERLSRRRVCAQCGHATGGDAATRCVRCGGELVLRSDDTEDVVRERLRVYAESTRPLVDYYSSRSTFRAVDGNQPPAQVGAALAEAVQAVRTQPGAVAVEESSR